jgi:hypothetical protein
MSNLIGALIGAAIDRRDGDSGIKGAIIGAAAEGAIRIAAPVLVTYALGWAAQGVAGDGRPRSDRRPQRRAAVRRNLTRGCGFCWGRCS